MSSKGRGRGTKNTSSQNVQIPARPRNLHRYKTELCRAWGENRQCKYGDKCQVSIYQLFPFTPLSPLHLNFFVSPLLSADSAHTVQLSAEWNGAVWLSSHAHLCTAHAACFPQIAMQSMPVICNLLFSCFFLA